VAVFLPTLDNGFVNWDDPRAILDNPHLTELSAQSLRWMFTTFHMGPYQPLSWLSLALDHLIWGGFDPFGVHLTSILLHAAAAALFFLLSFRLLALAGREPPLQPWLLIVGAMAAALLWAVHPLRVESVAWATERRDVLSGAFFAATLVVWLSAVAPRQTITRRASIGRQIAAVALAAVAIGAKASAVTLPLVMLLLDWYPLARTSGAGPVAVRFRTLVLEKTPFLVLAAVGGIVAIVGQGRAGAMHAGDAIDGFQRLAIMIRGLAFYPVKTIWPAKLAPIYEIPHGGLSVDAALIGSALLLVVVTGAAVLASRRLPAVTAVWLCYLVMILPVSGLLQSGPQWAADRYSYLSCAPFALLAGAALVVGMARGKRVPALAMAGIVLLVLALLTQRQIGIWHDSMSLWNATIERRPEASIAYSNRGQLWVARGDWGRAESDLLTAVELFPVYSDALHNLAWVHGRRGNWAAAERVARQAISVSPSSGQAHLHLGEALARQGRLGEAVSAHERGLELEPDRAEGWLRLASLYQGTGRPAAAVAAAERALVLRPDSVLAHLLYAGVLQATGRGEQALAAVRRAIELDPTGVRARLVEAEILLVQGRRDEAHRALEEVLRVDPGNQRAKQLLDSLS
jgi:tetratricopeptide (TPR) repeat protein